MGFKIREEIPDKKNKYYISTKNGGYSTCIRPADYKKKSYFTGSVLANCVGYACGRFNEIIDEIEGCLQFKYKDLHCNAENFVTKAKSLGLEVTKEPTIGGIIVWAKGKTGDASDGAGHVEVVEKIIDKNTIYISGSNYNADFFFNKTRKNDNGRWGISSSYTYLGCIKNPAVKDIIVPPVKKNPLVNQVEVNVNKLRIRNLASLIGKVEGYCEQGFFNVLSVIAADGYTWYEISKDLFIASVNGVTYHKKIETTELKLILYDCNLRMREKPVNGNIITTMKPSDTIEIIDFLNIQSDKHQWLYVRCGDNIGYCQLDSTHSYIYK